MNVTIEDAQLSDAQEILDLQKLAYQSEAAIYNDYNLPPLTETLEELQARFKDHVFLKTVVTGVIAGSVRAQCDSETCYIGRLVVHPDCQGRGIGKQLMNAIECRFDNMMRYELFTGHKSKRNLSLYGKLGYEEVRREEISPGLTLVYLQKETVGTV